MQIGAQHDSDQASGSAGTSAGPDSPAGPNSAGSDPSDSDYVGRHRPHRLSLRRQRTRVGQLTEPQPN
jgi:hypothetical protein